MHLLRFPTKNYVEINGDNLVAQVHVDPINELPNAINAHLTLFDNNGYQSPDNKCNNDCTLQGDHVILQGDLIEYPGWLSNAGWHSGFKLSHLETSYQQSKAENNHKADSMVLEGG